MNHRLKVFAPIQFEIAMHKSDDEPMIITLMLIKNYQFLENKRETYT